MKDSPSPSHRPMTSLCVSRPSNQHPVRLIHHPIAFRCLVFKGPSDVFLLACQLSSSFLHPTSTIFLPIYSWLPRSLAPNPPPVLDQGEDISKYKLYSVHPSSYHSQHSCLPPRWLTIFKQNVIQQSKSLPTSTDLEELIYCAEGAPSEEELEETLTSGWDSDLVSIILLLPLIHPSCQSHKRPGKVSTTQAEKHLVVFQKDPSTTISCYTPACLTSHALPPHISPPGRKNKEIITNKHRSPPPANLSLCGHTHLPPLELTISPAVS
ncbi:hypothetical protein CRENBAI_008460 [Crenichthys baileyi]|uniref:Uncharacterized protein n=1 Tax=Crenichthys baileyi TaxID=28760 RepID=A0AAV9SC44_9TELE